MNTEKPTIDLKSEDFGSILICAVRYAMGRETYMPSIVIGYITPLIPYVSDRTIACMERDIREQSNFGETALGNEHIDRPGWIKLMYALEDERKRRGIRQWS